MTFCVIGSQPASQLASCNWPANQPCDKISTSQAVSWSDSWWQEDRGPDHIGPLFRVPALPLVPLGGVTYLTKARQVTQMSSSAHYMTLALLSGTICCFVSMSTYSYILAQNVEKCYRDYLLSRPIYSYPSNVNLMYYYTNVLLLRNYFSNHTSEVLWEKV